MHTARSKAVFPSCFLPSIEYLMLLHQYREVTIDIESIYIKQCVHNRSFILSPNGNQQLTVPVIFHSQEKSSIRTIKISYAEAWQKRHLGAIKAAYGRSAWFEFLYDDLEDVFNTKFEYLYQLNNVLLEFVLKKIKSPILLNSVMENDFDEQLILSTAKTTSPLIIQEFRPYAQVFQDRFGFTRNLSCLDLLLNVGNKGMDYLS